MAFAFPSVGTNTGALRPGILQRISLFRTGSASAAALDLAPIVKVPTRQGFYHYFAENDAFVTDGPQGIQPVNYDTPATAGGLRINSASYQSNMFRWGYQTFSLKQVEEFAARGEDITARYAEKLSVQGLQHHAKLVGAALNDNANYGASPITPTDATLASAQLQEAFNEAIESMAAQGCDVTSGKWVAATTLPTARRLIKKNEVFDMGYSIAAASVGGSLSQVRTGTADVTQLGSFFATRLLVPVELVVLPQFLPTMASQTGDAVVDLGKIALFKVAEGYGDSGFLQTFTPDPSAATGIIYSYDQNNPKGIGMHVESDYGVVVLGGPQNKWARVIDGVTA